MKTMTHKVQKTVKAAGDEKGKRIEVGKINYLCPTLEEISQHLAKPESFIFEKDEAGKEIQGSYDDDFSSFIDNAVQDACIKKLTAKLVSQSVQLKPGATLWSDLKGLLAETVRGKHFTVAAEYKAAMVAYVSGLSKSDKFKADVLNFILNPAVLSQTTPVNKGIIERIVSAFLETLTEEQVERFDRKLIEIGEAIAFVPGGLEDA